jgi:signal transduction histidine kinase
VGAIIARVIPTRVPQRHLMPVRSLAPFAPLIVVIAALASTPIFDAASIALWLGIHAVTLLVAGVVGVGLSGLVRRAGVVTVSLWWVIAMGAVVGGVKAFGTIAVEGILGLVDAPPEALIARALGSVAVGMWLVSIFALGKTGLDSLEAARDEVIRRNVATRLAEEIHIPRGEVSQSLAAISALRRDVADSERRPQPDDIRAVVDSTIRPLSRALWAVENRRYPATKLVALYRVALRSFTARAWLIALVWSATTFTAFVAQSGFVYAATYSVAVGLVAFVVFSVVRLGWTESITVSLVVVTSSSVGSVVVGYLLTGLILGTSTQVADLVGIVSGVVWMVFVVLGSSILSGVMQLREVIRRDLDTGSTQELIRQRADDDTAIASTKRLATRLHGSVQSGLLGLAAALDRGSIHATEVDRKLAALARELELLHKTEDHLPEDLRKDHAGSLAEVVSQWRGIVDVAIDDTSVALLDPLLGTRPETIELLREALTNAHRHGRATRVTIAATAEGNTGDITVTVTDNGYGPTNGTPGLGSTLLDAWTASRWSLRQSPTGGSQLVATMSPTPNKPVLRTTR